MPVARARLPYLAPPSDYFSEEAHVAELGLIDQVWQPLAPGARAAGRVVSSLGSLRWSRPHSSGRPLEEELPAATRAIAARALSAGFQLTSFFSIAHPCNWKIPIENVLESYHVDSLHNNVLARHPSLFRVFGGRELTHELGDGYSSYLDTFGASSWLYRRVLDALYEDPSPDYVHHHLLPNVILSTTGPFSFVQQVLPVGPRRSLSNVWLYLRRSERLRWVPLVRRASGAVATAAIRRILDEDGAVYEAVQRGIESSTQPGALGTREERIWHFHRYLEDAKRPRAA